MKVVLSVLSLLAMTNTLNVKEDFGVALQCLFVERIKK